MQQGVAIRNGCWRIALRDIFKHQISAAVGDSLQHGDRIADGGGVPELGWLANGFNSSKMRAPVQVARLRYNFGQMLHNWLFALGHAALLLFGECVYIETRYSDVEIIATDLEGVRLSNVEVEFYEPESGALRQKSNSVVTRVLYGKYHLRIYSGGFHSAWREVNIDQQTLRVRVDLEFRDQGCLTTHADIGGRVVRDGRQGELWVKVVPLRGVGGGEARVAETGHFLISGLNHTTYLLTVMQDETVLHQQVVKTFPDEGKRAAKLVIALDNAARRQ
ncbi:hypothetical protein [Paludibaculum fermentans]|uniref:hypothetical protein n=1 Tax=Paludibaculum fermentans TaxID=1473598 RepID=UPI003EC0464F